MTAYSHFFKTLHDEKEPVGLLGRGTHCSILRAVVFQGPNREPLQTAQFADFAIIWDEDHDTRVIEAVELIYRIGALGSFLMIGERKGILNGVVSDRVSPSHFKYLENMLHAVAQSLEDPWSASIATIGQATPIINDDDDRVSLYLANLRMLWCLGTKTIESYATKEGTQLSKLQLSFNCPECEHVFQGSGFDGIDAHWRAKHNHIMPYEEAWPLIRDRKYIKGGSLGAFKRRI